MGSLDRQIPGIYQPGAPRLASIGGSPVGHVALATAGSAAEDLGLLAHGLIGAGLRSSAEQAEIEGARAGVQAALEGRALEVDGSDSAFQPVRDAYARSAEAAYGQGLELQLERQLAAAAEEAGADPDAYARRADELGKQVLGQAGGLAIAPGLQLAFERAKSRGMAGAQREQQRQAATMGAANIRALYDERYRRATNEARSAGDAAAAADTLADIGAQLDQALKAGWLSDAEWAAMKLGAQEDVKSEAALGAFERAPSEAALQQFVERAGTDFTPQQRDRISARMSSILAHRQSQVEAAQRQVGQDVRTAIQMIEHGIEPADLDSLQRRASGTPWGEHLAVAVDARQEARALAQLPPAQQQARLADLRATLDVIRAGKVDVEDGPDTMTRLAAAEQVLAGGFKALQRTQEMIGKGQLMDRATELGLVEPAPISLGSAEDLAAGLDARLQDLPTLETHFGAGNANPFTSAEIEVLADTLSAGAEQTEAQGAILGTLYQKLGTERMQAVMAAVAPKAPSMATIGAIAAEQPAIGNQILRGRAIMAANPKIAGEDGQDFADAVQTAYGDLFREAPTTLARAREAARYLLAARQFEAGKLDGKPDAADVEQALKDVVGGVVDWEADDGWSSGTASRVIPPRPGMSADEMWNAVEALQDDELALNGQAPVSPDGEPITAELIKRRGRLTSYGPGQYLVDIGTVSAMDPANPGRRYVLDLRRVLSERENGDRDLRRAVERVQAGAF